METDDFWKNDKPEFIHDCNNCKFLGWYADKPGIINDLYICIHEDYYPIRARRGSIIRRFGNEGRAYWSMDLESCMRIANDGNHDFVGMAIKRAIQSGYITADMALELLKHL